VDILEDVSIDPNQHKNREPASLQLRVMTQKLSELGLTYEQDRLPTFKVLAKRFERAVNSTYAYGI
jgi:hypothetical protein